MANIPAFQASDASSILAARTIQKARLCYVLFEWYECETELGSPGAQQDAMLKRMVVPIVDSNDNVIEYKERSDINFQNDIFRSASLWIKNNKNEVLLAQRRDDKKVDPGKWGEAVGGTVEDKDGYEQTMLRESEEEIGIKGFTYKIGPKQYIDYPYKYFVQWYIATIDMNISDFKVQQDEIQSIMWIPYEELKIDIIKNPQKYVTGLSEVISEL